MLPELLRSRTSFALIRLGALLRQDCAERLAQLGLSQHQHAVLCALAEFGPAAQKDVAARLELDSGDLVAFLDGLQLAGLICRDRDARDRRRQILTITPLGRETLAEAERLLDEAEHLLPEATAGRLTPADLSDLHRGAVRILAGRAPATWSPGEHLD